MAKHTYLGAMEKTYLTQIIKKYIDVIQNKRSDAYTKEQKRKCWEKVAEEFNLFGGTVRSANQLNKCWQNLKSRAKKENAALGIALEHSGIAGPSLLTDSTLYVNKVLGENQISPTVGQFDEDNDSYDSSMPGSAAAALVTVKVEPPVDDEEEVCVPDDEVDEVPVETVHIEDGDGDNFQASQSNSHSTVCSSPPPRELPAETPNDQGAEFFTQPSTKKRKTNKMLQEEFLQLDRSETNNSSGLFQVGASSSASTSGSLSSSSSLFSSTSKSLLCKILTA
ncbi:hypothetical protein CHUAL_002897 [Chamberlinius hualienensis]